MTVPARTVYAPGMACADLTPLIATTMRELAPGDLLEVHTDDPAAALSIPAWCRLTHNTLVRAVRAPPSSDPSGNRTTFHIRKKESTA